mmetsp:Transcript_42430/g.102154  ORF Transcript_42430/g.102154 Transcript_42430/m.102154 type:complete len:233 (+) Transcript_42430:277-975(+)
MLLRVSLGFLRQLAQHIADQTLHLGKHVLLGRSPSRDLGQHHRQCHVFLVPSQLSQRGQSAVDRVILGAGGCRQLKEAIGTASRSSSLLLDDLLGRRQCLELILAVCYAGLVIRGLLHAVGLELGQSVAVGGGILLGLLEVRLCVCLQLTVARELASGSCDLLVFGLQLIRQGLLEHVEVELRLCLGFLAVGTLPLGLLEQIAQQVQDRCSSRMSLVSGSLRSLLQLILAVL